MNEPVVLPNCVKVIVNHNVKLYISDSILVFIKWNLNSMIFKPELELGRLEDWSWPFLASSTFLVSNNCNFPSNEKSKEKELFLFD